MAHDNRQAPAAENYSGTILPTKSVDTNAHSYYIDAGWHFKHFIYDMPRISSGMCLAIERRCYSITMCLIAWAHS